MVQYYYFERFSSQFQNENLKIAAALLPKFKMDWVNDVFDKEELRAKNTNLFPDISLNATNSNPKKHSFFNFYVNGRCHDVFDLYHANPEKTLQSLPKGLRGIFIKYNI